jgi:hypothetical protein
MAFINPVTDDAVSWSPSAAVKTKTNSTLVQLTTTDDTETTAITITPPNNALYQFRATVLARSSTGKSYLVELRATYEQTSGTWTPVEAPWGWNEFHLGFPVTVRAWFEQSGSSVLLKVVGEDTVTVDWSANIHVQIVSNTALNGSVGVDPASLSLTGFWQDYAGGTWTGTASAGASSGRTLVAGNVPSVGASFGAHASAEFNGTNDYLDSAITGNNYLSASAYTMEVVCDIASYVASGAIYEEALIFGANTSLYIAVSTSGVQAGHLNSISGTQSTPRVSLPALGTKLCIQVRFASGTLGIRVNGGSWAETSGADDCDVLSARTLRAGVNYDLSTFFAGRIARIFTASSGLSDATLNGTYAHAQSNFGVP